MLVALGVMALGAAAQAQQVAQMLNGVRAEEGLGPVQASPMLEAAAMAHALDMSENGFFDHRGSDGSDVMARAKTAGYGPCVIAENIAQGQTDLRQVLGDWVNSPGHRANILLDSITDYGLVRAEGDIWVLVLGQGGC
ncbi:CAP domain-containing protein [Tropicibacter naphthalenivorans]|nr:CAP domain-containing protein [Tropicibacter naphthalenivorans]